MRRLVWTNTFVRAYKRFSRRHPQLLEKLRGVLEQLSVDPFQPQLRTHKLRGELEGVWACWVERDVRLLFEPVCVRGEWFLLSSLPFCSSQASPSGAGNVAHINFQQQERWRVEVARILIRAGANPAQKDKEGKTAADFAREEGSVQLARFLHQASAGRE